MTSRQTGTPVSSHAHCAIPLPTICVAIAALLVPACQSTPPPNKPTVREAWQNTQPPTFAPPRQTAESEPNRPIARVGGVPIEQARIMDILIEGHGVNLLEQIISLEAARQAARNAGIVVSRADIDDEYIRSLDDLLGDAAAGQTREMRQRAGESLLDQMLESRNSTRAEYMIVMERNVILRKLVQAELDITEEALQLEFDRMYGERVEIRHIQLQSPGEYQQVADERANGAEFGDLALRYSANRASAERLGLLPPFPKNDPSIPEPIRREAFLLPPGQDSSPIRVNDWFHIIRVERRMPAANVEFDEVKGAVEQSLRRRLTENAMRDKYVEIFNAADIEFEDPRFKELFYDKHPDHGAATP